MNSMTLADIHHNCKYNNLNGIFAVMASNLVMPFVAVLALKLGASNLQMGLISSLPPAVGLVAMLPGAFFVEKFATKGKVTGVFILFHRFFFVLLALTPVLPAHQVWFLVLVNGLMNFPGAIANVAWQSFIAGAIPAEHRGQAFAQRNRLTSLFGIIITFVAGQIFRLVPEANHAGLYQLFFVLAFAFALLEVYFHFQIREFAPAAVPNRTGPGLRASLAMLVSSRPYVVFAGCSLLFHFGWQMAWPLFNIYQVSYLGADEFWISLISVVNGGMAMFSYGLWQRFAHRRGNQFALIFATLGISASPFLYALSANLYQIIFINGLIGVAIAGISLVLFNSLLEVVPDQGRTIYIAVYTTLINVSAMIAPMVGIALLEGFNIFTALVVAGCLRLLGTASFALRHYRTKGTKAHCNPAA